MLGVVFRGQVPLADSGFIGDFVAPAFMLVVEVDGSVHQHTRRADAQREEKLRRRGYIVLRLDAELVMRDLAGAIALVTQAVERLRPVASRAPPVTRNAMATGACTACVERIAPSRSSEWDQRFESGSP